MKDYLLQHPYLVMAVAVVLCQLAGIGVGLLLIRWWEGCK